MAKIGILTFHRSYNYGAFMQCYALSNRLMKDFPEHTVEVIDYATAQVGKNYATSLSAYLLNGKKDLKSILIKVYSLLNNPRMLRQRRALYDNFEKEICFLPCSKRTIITDDYEGVFDDIKNEYDVIIVGSDAVWEFKTYPFPNAYFLNGDLGKTRLMSYAASSDRMHISDIGESTKKYLKDAFRRFDYLGVRDVATENLIGSIDPKLGLNHNCDPTIFLQLDTLPKNLERVKEDLSKHNIDLTKPIICVMGPSKLCKMVREMFGNKYQIVAIYYYSKYADYYINKLTPIEWAQVFSLFSVTVTSFFHGSLLSLKNGCPTIATDYWYQVDDKHLTKIADIYERLGLKDHYFFMADVKIKNEIDKIKTQIEYYIENPDKEAIASALSKEAQSYNSFKCALKDVLNELSGSSGI